MFLSLSFLITFYQQRKSGQELERYLKYKPGGELLLGSLADSRLASFLLQPGNGAAHGGRSLLHQITVMTTSLRHTHSRSDLGNPSVRTPSLLR